ncbi:phosphotransferase family protein [Catellatospora tritici]|uniref:phosphotransferase family protein n=1 Tax=Catellatospora tritici TaxID=2851566 RepID=UPI001C2D52D7|nr:aminoglycoside phosphotransferase family protein [Catellatospora tritici]MBV1850549.1 aminoglycoside phosphotransferase family protein [Catellatospora tritici]
MSRTPRRLADVRAVVAAHLPGYPTEAVRLLGEGLDNVAYEVGGELIVRFGKEPDPVRRAALADREARLLTAVAEVSPLPVPIPAFAAPEQGCLAYVKLPGVPLSGMSTHWRQAHGTAIAAVLGGLLDVLHASPLDRWAGLVDTDDQPPAQWLLEAAETYRTVAGWIPAAHRRAAEAFLGTAPPSGGHRLVFSHNDLGIEHVLVDPVGCAVTGVIDWSDAAIVDPAYDLGLLCRDLGPAALRAALARRQDDTAALAERAVFHARCSVFEDLAYGIETARDTYVANSLAAMEWLFPA